MNYKDISTIVQQQSIPNTIQVDVLTRAKNLINRGFEVEAIVSLNTVTLDVYDEDGTRVDRINKTFSKISVVPIDTEDEVINQDDVEIRE